MRDHVSISFFCAFLLSEQGFFQNCKQSEAEKAMGEHEAEGDPGSHRRGRRAGRHHHPGCYATPQWEQRRGRFRLTLKKKGGEGESLWLLRKSQRGFIC